MIFETRKAKYLFDNIKNGDFIAFYKKPWYYLFARLIFLVTGQKLSHVAGIFDVKRRKNNLTFKLGEQTVSHNKIITRYSIVKVNENDYTLDSRFKNNKEDVYYLSNRHEISEEQNKKLEAYWKISESYSLAELFFTQNWFYRFFGNKTKIYDNNCSTACRASMVQINIKDKKFDDKVPNPAEFARFSYIEHITKIEF